MARVAARAHRGDMVLGKLRKLTAERRARELYERYGGRPWPLIDERTRQHYRGLVAEGIDGAGRPLERRPVWRRGRGQLPAGGY
jgi:hypothetical protein